MPKFSADAQVTQELKFKPDPLKNGGLCLGNLLSVEVTRSDAEKNTSDGEYGHMSIPQLVFRFKQVKDNAADPDRFHVHRERVINSMTSEGETVAQETLDSLYQSMWFRIKHMYDRMIDKPIDQKKLDAVIVDEHAKPAERIEQFFKFFTFVADLFNKGDGGKPIFKKEETFVLKLVADYTTRKYYTFPTFVGQGFIERAKFKTVGDKKVLNTTLEIKPNESIELGAGKVVARDTADNSEIPANIRAIMESQ
jgi:hypothetical protein